MLDNANTVLLATFTITLFWNAGWTAHWIKHLIMLKGVVSWYLPHAIHINIMTPLKGNVFISLFVHLYRGMMNITIVVLIFLSLHPKVQATWFTRISRHMRLIMIPKKLMINFWKIVLLTHHFTLHPTNYASTVLRLILISISRLRNASTVVTTDMIQPWESVLILHFLQTLQTPKILITPWTDLWWISSENDHRQILLLYKNQIKFSTFITFFNIKFYSTLKSLIIAQSL